MNVPEASVVIPLYNKAPYIKRAIDSVLSQTVQNFEIIIINDGSTDGSEKIVEEYHDSRIHLINQENRGVSSARNHGIDVANAELIAFLDADDEWLPEFLETILRLRKKYPDAGMYTTLTSYVSDNGRETIQRVHGIQSDWEGIIPSVFYCAAMTGCGIFPGQSSSIAIPKTVFRKVGKFREDSTMGEDQDMWGRIALYYTNAHSSKALVRYMHDDVSSLTRIKTLKILDRYPFQSSIDELVDKGEIYPETMSYDLKLYLNSLNIGLASNYYSIGNNKRARKMLKNVTYPELRVLKFKCYIMTYLPKVLVPYISKVILKIQRFNRN